MTAAVSASKKDRFLASFLKNNSAFSFEPYFNLKNFMLYAASETTRIKDFG